MRRAFIIALSVLGILLVLLAGFVGVLQTGFARDRIRLWIADLTAGTTTQVHLDAIEGFVPFDMRLTGLRLSDHDGTWLSADRISVAWSPLDLLGGRLQVDEVLTGSIDLARLPVPAKTQTPEPPGPLIPQLPVAIDLRRLSVERLALAAPILGQSAALSLNASAKLGEIGDDLSASLTVQQLSGNTGTAAIDLAYRPDQEFLSLTGKVEEPQGGIVGRLLGLPQGSDLRVTLDGQGPLDAWQGRMNARLDGDPLLDLSGERSRAGGTCDLLHAPSTSRRDPAGASSTSDGRRRRCERHVSRSHPTAAQSTCSSSPRNQQQEQSRHPASSD